MNSSEQSKVYELHTPVAASFPDQARDQEILPLQRKNQQMKNQDKNILLLWQIDQMLYQILF